MYDPAVMYRFPPVYVEGTVPPGASSPTGTFVSIHPDLVCLVMWRDALTLQSRQLMRSLVLAFHSARQLNLEPVARAYNHDCRIGSASHMGSFITVRLDAEATQEVVRLALSWFEDEVILGPMALLHVPMP